MSRLSLLALGAAACGTQITVSQINAPPPGIRRHSSDQVEVLSGSAPPRPNVAFAILVAHRGEDTFAQALAKLKTSAGALGCDAIVIDKVSGSMRDVEPAEMAATCVVYTTRTAGG